jgi:hypothetical protein
MILFISIFSLLSFNLFLSTNNRLLFCLVLKRMRCRRIGANMRLIFIGWVAYSHESR